ncbi:DUF2513 domain-containing protein [Rummeliibacillus sp. POC4]|uniref:DUF2513 domain-containing protein n=1 Tax=Rummeliibacillus sp. POC4 TaxID=2305899 RepID=UPI001313F3D1|nr:DUF2513 domain-containing protein [Rummeliibacillus sp. POC4]
MKLNHDCVRDLLLAVEDIPSLTGWYSIPQLMKNENLKDKHYSIDEIAYTATCLGDAGFIKTDPNNREPEYYTIQRMTWNGHAFLDDIRDPKVWKKTKEIASNLASVSVKSLFEISTNLARKYVGLD